MDTVQFIENILDIKLLDYQKKMIENIEKYPDYKIIFSKERSIPSWFLACVINAIKIKD